MTRRHLVALTAVAGLILGSANAFARGAAAPAPTVESSATPTRVAVPVWLSSYPVYDRHGRRVGAATWRISPAGGNCCETYVSATPGGRIVESGGTYPWYTDDNGRHWYQVKFDIPDQNDNGKAIAGGEGATVVVGSDVYGVTWDAYSGDHLQAYRYTAQTDSWRVSEVALKTPFYDRPWLTYAQGRFTLDGEPTKQLLDVMGGGVTKDVETLSADGLRYGDASYPYLDEQQSPAGRVRVRVARNPLADWWQPYAWTGTLPLTGGGLLRFDNGEDVSGSSGCATARLVPSSATWQCVRMPARFRGVVRQEIARLPHGGLPGPLPARAGARHLS